MSAVAAVDPGRVRMHSISAIGRAVRRITPRAVGVTLAIAMALQVWFLYEAIFGGNGGPGSRYLSLMIVHLLIAFGMMFTTFVADEFVALGAPPLSAYATGILAGSALGSVGEWVVHLALARMQVALPGLVVDATGAYAVFVFFEYLIWGAIAVWIYVNFREEMRAGARVTASRLQRAKTQRRALEAQLQALQAQVEPRFLLDTLAHVRDRYVSDAAAGSATLGALIAYLRAVLPRLRASSSELGREIGLVRAWLDVIRVSTTAAVDFDARIDDALAHASMPPMVLLPLVNLALGGHPAGRGFEVDIDACVEDRALRVSIRCTGDGVAAIGEDAALVPIRTRLRALYGSEGRLSFHASDAGGVIVVGIPLEATDRHHR